MSTTERQEPTSPKSSSGRIGRAAKVRTRRKRRGTPPELESQTVQVLELIRKGFDEHDGPSLEPAETSTDPIANRWGNHAQGIRLLLEELQKDTEVAAAIRADLASALSSAASALARQPTSRASLDHAREQGQYEPCDYVAGREQVSHAERARLVAERLQARHSRSALPSMLRDVETVVHQTQLAHLKAAVAVSVQSRDAPHGSNSVVASFVRVADRFGEIADISRSLRQQLESPTMTKDSVETTHSLSLTLLEAAQESSRSTAELRRNLHLAENLPVDDHGEPVVGPLSSFGGMLDLRACLQHSRLDAGLASTFRSVGDLLKRALLTVWGSSDERESRSPDPSVVTAK